MDKKVRRSLSRNERIVLDGLYLEELSKELFSMLKPGISTVEIADYFDKKMFADKYMFYPLSIELDSFAINCAPIHPHKLHKDSILSFTFQIYGHKFDNVKDRFMLKCAYSFSMNGKDYIRLLDVAKDTCTKAMKVCGPDVKLTVPRDVIIKSLETSLEIPIKSIMNIYSVNLDGHDKIIPQTRKIPTAARNNVAGIMRSGELYYIDIHTTNSSNDELAIDFSPYPTMFVMVIHHNRKEFNRRLQILNHKHRASVKILNTLIKYYPPGKVFSLREFSELYKEKTKTTLKVDNMKPLHMADMIRGYPTLFIEHNFNIKQKELYRLAAEKSVLGKKLSNAKTAKEKKDINIELERIQAARSEIKNNELICVHFGHTILITDTGMKFIC
jgi:methionine aminopeptidase